MLDSWQRIEKVVNWTGLSVNAFARSIGLKRAENLYQIKKGNHGISKELSELIAAKHPSISRSWLLTGQGGMFLDESPDNAVKIPFYNTDIIRLLHSGRYPDPSEYMSIPMFGDCEAAAPHMNNSMEPDIPCGAVLFIRKTEPGNILPGNTYLVVSRLFIGVRIIRRDPGSAEIRLVPRNGRDYDEVIINRDDITRLYEVAGYLVEK